MSVGVPVRLTYIGGPTALLELAGLRFRTGDTVWFEGVEEVTTRFSPEVAILFAGAARAPEVGPAHLTFTANEAVRVARALPRATVVPLHFEGWAHFSESRTDIERAPCRGGALRPVAPADRGTSTRPFTGLAFRSRLLLRGAMPCCHP